MSAVLCDTCLFLSLWDEDDATRFRLTSENFFRIARLKGIVICVSSETRKEIEKNLELAVYLADFDKYLKELYDEGRLDYTTISENFTKEDIYEIRDIRQKARPLGLDISTSDAKLILIAKKKGLPLVTNENDIVDFCNSTNYCKALYPDETFQ